MIEHMFGSEADRSFAGILSALEAFVTGLEPGEYAPADVPVVLARVARAEKLCGAARLLLSKRAASLLDDRSDGHASAAKWLAEQQGTSVGQARRELELAGALRDQPELSDALRSGRLSPTQAAVILPAAEADPAAAPDLIETARREPLGVLRGRSRAVVAGSRSEAEAKAHAIWQHSRRFLELGVTDDGMVSLRGEFPPIEGAALRTALEREARRVFAEARKGGLREPHRAYLADALVGLCRGGAFRSGVPEAELVLVCNAESLRGGEVAEGETCEVRGVGRVPVAAVEYLFGAAWAKAIVRDGVDVTSVTHLHRTIPAHVRTALLVRDPTCLVSGCGVTWGLEIDHIVALKDGGRTELENLGPACGRHHFLKSYCGWAFVGRPGEWSFVRLRPGEKVVRTGDRFAVARIGGAVSGAPPEPGAGSDVDFDDEPLDPDEQPCTSAVEALCCRSRSPAVTARLGSVPPAWCRRPRRSRQPEFGPPNPLISGRQGIPSTGPVPEPSRRSTRSGPPRPADPPDQSGKWSEHSRFSEATHLRHLGADLRPTLGLEGESPSGNPNVVAGGGLLAVLVGQVRVLHRSDEGPVRADGASLEPRQPEADGLQ